MWGLTPLMLSACQAIGLQWKYRYRLTAEVQHGDAISTGSSVVEVTRTKGYDGIGGRARGDAVAVDIADRGTLFLLLRSDRLSVDWPVAVPHDAFEAQLGSRAMVDPALLDKLVGMTGAKATLTSDIYPTLVHFRDINNPATVEKIDPANLAATFGLGTKLIKISMQITDDALTKGIYRRFPWWSQYISKHFDGSDASSNDLTNYNISAYLSSLSFGAPRQSWM